MPMKVHKKTVYKCDICAKTEEWITGKWIAHFFLLSAKRMIEHEFHLCSWECDNKITAMSKSERLELYNKIL